MEQTAQKSDKARANGFSLYQRHEALIHAIRLERANRDNRLPKASEIVQDAIEELGLRELGAIRFGQVIAEPA